MRQLREAIYRTANNASSLSFAVTVITSLVFLWFMPDRWIVPAAVVGFVTRSALIAFDRESLGIDHMLSWINDKTDRDWEQTTGSPPPKSAAMCALWLQSPVAWTAPICRRVDALRGVGDLSTARFVLADAVPADKIEAADIACSRFEIEFEERGEADLSAWAAAATDLPEDEARDNRAQIALYAAAMEAGKGGEWRAPLHRLLAADGPFRPPILAALRPYLTRYSTVALALALVGLFEFVVRYAAPAF